MKWLAGLAIVVGGVVGLYYLKYPVYSYRYRLTVSIEVDGRVRTGSSVIEVGWQRGPAIGDVGGYAPEIRGQAPLVDLGARGVVVATLITGEGYGPAKDGALSAQWFAAEAFDNHSTDGEISGLPKLRGKRSLALDKLPRLLWFSNPQDPATAKKMLAHDITTILGLDARFVGVSVEIVQDPIVIDLRQKLPWLISLEPGRMHTPLIRLSDNLVLSRYMFIGGAS